MLTLMALGGLIATAALAVLVLGSVLFLVKAVLLLVFLPFRIIGFGLHLLLFPVKLLLGLLFLPVLLVVGGIVLVAVVLGGLVSLLAPLVPFALLALIVWAVAKAFSKPRTALVR